MNQPSVSVLLPVYNAASFLQQAIDSILGQTLQDFELLLVDDGSTDGSVDIIANQTDTRVHSVFRKHTGLVPALNDGLCLARAPLIARMDADDVALPRRLAVQVDFLKLHPGVAALGAAAQQIDRDGAPFGGTLSGEQTHEQILARLTGGDGSGLIHPTVMFRRDVALACGGYRIEFPVIEDADLWLRLARVGRLHSHPDVLLFLRKHGGNVTMVHISMNLEAQIRVRVCHQIWSLTGVDPVDHAPDLWCRAREHIHQLCEDRRLLSILTARNRLKEGSHGHLDPRPAAVFAKLMRRPWLAKGLRFHRIKDEVVHAAVSQLRAQIHHSTAIGR